PTDVRNKSIVAINQGWNGQGPPIYGANLANYRKRAIDNIFYRGLANVQRVATGTVDLLSGVTGGGGGVPAVNPAAIQNFCNLPTMINIQGGGHPILPEIS